MSDTRIKFEKAELQMKQLPRAEEIIPKRNTYSESVMLSRTSTGGLGNCYESWIQNERGIWMQREKPLDKCESILTMIEQNFYIILQF